MPSPENFDKSGSKQIQPALATPKSVPSQAKINYASVQCNAIDFLPHARPVNQIPDELTFPRAEVYQEVNEIARQIAQSDMKTTPLHDGGAENVFEGRNMPSMSFCSAGLSSVDRSK